MGVDCLARWFVALACAHSHELHDSAVSLAEHVEADVLIVTMTLADHVINNEDDLDDHQREVLRQMHVVPGFGARVSCLRALRAEEVAIAARLGRRFGWQPSESAEIMRDYWHSTMGDGHPESFLAWLRWVAEHAAE